MDKAKSTKNAGKAKTPQKSVPVIDPIDEDFAECVDKVRFAITAKKKALADIENYGEDLINMFLEKKEEEARKLNFRKSFTFKGKTESVMVKHSNRALKINIDDLEQIQKILSADEFEMLLEKKLAIDVKPEVLIEDSPLQKKLWNMLGKTEEERNQNFDLFFEPNNSLTIKPDFDRNIFQLGLKAFKNLAVFVRLIKPALQ